MNDQITISTFQLFSMFPDQETARKYLENKLWPSGPICPKCRLGARVSARKGGFYRCNACSLDFTVRTGTIFERSHVPLHKWIYAIYLLLTARKGISSLQLSKQLSITQKSAWFLLQRLREACGNDLRMLHGVVEVDETYIGGRETNKHADKKIENAGPKSGKTIVLGMREREGRTFAKPVLESSGPALKGEIMNRVVRGTTVHTDEWPGYNFMRGFNHKTVNHSAKEYVRGEVHTNGIESVWAVLKRGLHGVYHHASKKHLGRYVDEFTFRLNDGKVQIPTLDRMSSLIKASQGRRLTYKDLIA